MTDDPLEVDKSLPMSLHPHGQKSSAKDTSPTNLVESMGVSPIDGTAGATIEAMVDLYVVENMVMWSVDHRKSQSKEQVSHGAQKRFIKMTQNKKIAGKAAVSCLRGVQRKGEPPCSQDYVGDIIFLLPGTQWV